MESRLQTENARIISEILGVGTLAHLQGAVLQDFRSGIHILQSQDNWIVAEATDLFNGMRQELESLSKQISDNTLQIVTTKVSTQAELKAVSILLKRIDEVNKAMAAITTSLNSIPFKRELQLHAHIMEEQMQQVAEINTGLTTAME
jgi:hypothetical protein